MNLDDLRWALSPSTAASIGRIVAPHNGFNHRNMSQSFIAYTRISAQKQSIHGVSLKEQRRAITAYAVRHQLSITAWYEEITTAAKRGRPDFRAALEKLTEGKGNLGLIMHKIDRGTRNLKDWETSAKQSIVVLRSVSPMMTSIAVRVEVVSLQTSQAVIAADYIRNLRDEVKKGIEGRLRQGLYPFAAPRSYLDGSSGKAKLPDTARAPLIVYMFQLYVSGECSLRDLGDQLAIRGLERADGRPLRTIM